MVADMANLGDVARNKEAVGLAVRKLGMRPSQGMVEQAVFQFMSLCIPRSQEVDSISFQVCMELHAYTLPKASCMTKHKVPSIRCSPGCSSI